MDDRLAAWGRAVKSAQPGTGRKAGLPPLWLFTDWARIGDPVAVARRLPAGLCGVVFRDDSRADREAVGRRLAQVCRARRLMLVVAGDWRLAAALGAGLHLRGGRRPPCSRRFPMVTSSAHGLADIHRARRAGARLVFLSPAFPTESHPGAPALGAVRWAAMARGGGVAALGGVSGAVVRRLSLAGCRAVGAIGALA